MTLPDDIPLIPEPTQSYLNERQRVTYSAHREEMLDWLYTLGKEPERGEGYAYHTVKSTAYRLDKFYRWVWDEEGYTSSITHDHADAFIREIAGWDQANSSKAKFVKAIMRLFKWQAHEQGGEEWESDISFYSRNGASQPRDYLTKEERSKVREAALEYGSIPAYSTVTPQERSRWKAYLAMRFSKKKSEVTLDDWKKANGWKIPSLVFASLDAGLRPVEVKRATVGWVDVENELLRIPREESSKGDENWHVAIRSQTASALARWLDERQAHSVYKGSDALWLTREGNPYQRYSLRYLLHQLCDIADISIENRRMSWYAIRHSVGTYMSREDGLAAAKAQLRHKSRRTTMRYDQTPVEDRQKALNRMG